MRRLLLICIMSIFATTSEVAAAPDIHDPRGYVAPESRAYASKRYRTHRKAVRVAKPSPSKPAASPRPRRSTTDLAHVAPALAAKARQIVAACGSRVVSGHRPGARIPAGHQSLHARYPAEAVDLAGNPGCIYRNLKGWPGGVSVDYAAVRHVHVSLASDKRERGSRFSHHAVQRYAAWPRTLRVNAELQ